MLVISKNILHEGFNKVTVNVHYKYEYGEKLCYFVYYTSNDLSEPISTLLNEGENIINTQYISTNLLGQIQFMGETFLESVVIQNIKCNII